MPRNKVVQVVVTDDVHAWLLELPGNESISKKVANVLQDAMSGRAVTAPEPPNPVVTALTQPIPNTVPTQPSPPVNWEGRLVAFQRFLNDALDRLQVVDNRLTAIESAKPQPPSDEPPTGRQQAMYDRLQRQITETANDVANLFRRVEQLEGSAGLDD